MNHLKTLRVDDMRLTELEHWWNDAELGWGEHPKYSQKQLSFKVPLVLV
jgi:hypothetical protein